LKDRAPVDELWITPVLPPHAWLALKAVINSDEGKAAMLIAINEGNAPLCGIDALLTGIIVDYAGKDDQILKSAGSLVAECMRAMGYIQGSPRPCPSGCSVGTGTMFTPPAS
jgi:hypothetical protein